MLVLSILTWFLHMSLGCMAIKTAEEFKINYIPLSSEPHCRDTIQLHCDKHAESDFSIIECLEDPKIYGSINEACKQAVEQRKKQFLTKQYFEHISPPNCLAEFGNFAECQFHTQSGLYVPCLLEHKREINEKLCIEHLNRVAVFVFDDYRLLTNLVESCQSDLKRYNCDKSSNSKLDQFVSNSQDLALHCLALRIGKLDENCRFQLLKVKELQSDDYHLDRNLYYACRDDRERLCQSVRSGNGEVYDCLRLNKFNRLMSQACSDAITEREQLNAIDYQISFSFTESCTVDIKKWHCDSTREPNSGASLSRIILCLESVEKLPTPTFAEKPNQLHPRCRNELHKVRHELLQDYRLSPNLMVHCDSTIKKHCQNQMHQPGYVIHCLMNLIRQTSQPSERPSEDCIDSIHDVLKVSDVQENVLLDPVIVQACHGVLNQQCVDKNQDHGSIFTCLFENRHHPSMTHMCRRHIYELYYFISRDVTMDDQLIRACLPDARQLCHLPASTTWDNIKPDAHLLTCLYNHRHPVKLANQTHIASLSPGCRTEVQRMMLDKAASVSLEPRVFESCLADLVAYCDDENDNDDERQENSNPGDSRLHQSESRIANLNDERGIESKNYLRDLKYGLPCLQNNLKRLRPECREAVVEVSAEAQEEPNLDKMIAEACQPAENRFCSNYEEPKDVVKCLIRHKHDMDMELACRWAIEHLQIIALNDIRISKGFQQACLQDIQTHCSQAIQQDKVSVITCLSQVLTNYRLQESQKMSLGSDNVGLIRPTKSPLSSRCASHLRFELLQRSESISLDPVLKKACRKDQDQLCGHVTEGKAQVISCLRQNRDLLSVKCHTVLFQRDILAAVENRVDYSLMQTCRGMIHVHCSAVVQDIDFGNAVDRDQDIVECLKGALQRDRGSFDPKCRSKLVNILELQSKDYRLDPHLIRDCHLDASRYCVSQVSNISAYERQGQVLKCLKIHFINRRNATARLSHRCYNRIRSIILWENMVYHLDPVLSRVCKSEIENQCSDALANDHDSSAELMNGLVGECLKQKLNRGLIRDPKCQQEIIMNIEEGRSDIHVDLVLYQACSIELQYYCSGVPTGNGRKMKCLLDMFDNTNSHDHLSPTCQKQLSERRQLWNSVAKLSDPQNLNELISHVSLTHSRNSLLVCLFIFVSLIFIAGLCCGRVTKRIPVEAKVK